MTAPPPFPGDPGITPEVVREHKITPDEYQRILAVLGREPTYTELGVFSVMWSEHCSYKSSRVHLRRLPTKGPRVIQGPGENAGVVDVGDGVAVVFKMESHNHPSFIEPHQGAATGVGGILRDVFTMGARPIAALDSLRLGRPDHPRTPELLRGVVEGIGGYGNAFGVPTVGGELQFDPSYDGNILVNAFTCGVARADRIFYGRASGVGNPVIYMGARTGRDGIHGATMASDEFGAVPAQRGAMQVGDPFMGKLLLEACLELFRSDALEGIQDMGAAGLTSSSVEMAARAGTGIEIDLDLVPRRARHMRPYELLLSESQERMLLVARRGHEQQVIDICRSWDLDVAVVGRVTDTGRWVITATPGLDPLAEGERAQPAPQIVCDLPLGALADEAPVYDRPRAPRTAAAPPGGAPAPVPADWTGELLAMCGSPNLGSRRWVWRQYDHIVRGGTVVGPGSDAAVIRVACEGSKGTVDKLLAFAVDGNGRWVDVDAFVGGAMAVAEVCRNLVCSGAEPVGLTDCLNFGNPERPEVMESIARAIDGIAAACVALGVPVVSGNVSLYNETTLASGARVAILPTPTIGGVGLLASADHRMTAWFKRAGEAVLVLGEVVAASGSLAGSEYLARHGVARRVGIAIDLEAERRLQVLVLRLIRSGKLSSAHDASEGGLLVALAECASTAPRAEDDIGADVDLGALGDASTGEALVAACFGEAPSRVVVSLPVAALGDVLAEASAGGVPARRVGTTVDGRFSFAIGSARGDLAPTRIRAAREAALDPIVLGR